MKKTYRHALKAQSRPAKAGCYSEEKFRETLCRAKAAFADSEAEEVISPAEFLYQQSKYIKKRYLILQGLLLLLLWYMLHLSESNYYIQRGMGIGASLFAVLLLPELWKSRNCHALEIEGASCFSLRQLYTARIFFLALLDFLMLLAFTLPVILTGRVAASEIMIQFFLPYLVTCCICFRILCSRRMGSEMLSILLCVVFCGLWTQLVLNEKIYDAVSLPVWIAMTAAAGFFLGYCIHRALHSCTQMWEVNTQWN